MTRCPIGHVCHGTSAVVSTSSLWEACVTSECGSGAPVVCREFPEVSLLMTDSTVHRFAVSLGELTNNRLLVAVAMTVA